MNLLTYLVIGIGSALGGLARYACGRAAMAMAGAAFPWGTIRVNLIGSLVIGFFATLTRPDGGFPASLLTRQFVMVGLCGGYTTFSSFSLETLQLLQAGRPLLAAANILLSLVLCLGGVWIGHMIATVIHK